MINNKEEIYFLIISLRGGGAERQVSYLIEEFPNAKIICLNDGNDYNIDPSKIIVLNRSRYFFKNKYFNLFYFVWLLNKKIDFNRETVIVSFMDLPNIINFLLNKIRNFKSILSIRTNIKEHYNRSFFYKIFFWFIVQFYKKCDFLITNSVGSKIDLVKLGVPANRITVIENMFNHKRIVELSNIVPDYQWERIFKFETIVCIGSIKEAKGYENLLNVFDEINKINKNVKLIIVGDGPLKNKLINLCQKKSLRFYNFENKILSEFYDVYFAGFQTNPYWFSKNASIYLLPSLYEGMPNSLIEAMISGAFILSADCNSGPREILAPNTIIDNLTTNMEFVEFGVLLPKFNFDGNNTKVENIWVDSINLLLKDEKIKTKYKQKIQNRAQDFSINNIIKIWKDTILNYHHPQK